MYNKRHINLLLGLLATASVYFVSCKAKGDYTGREYMPDMAHSKAYEYYSPGRTMLLANGAGGVDTVNVFPHKTSALKPVQGTIPRGSSGYYYANTPEDYERAGRELKNPFNASHKEVIGVGKEKYDIYCGICHGGGTGDGAIVKSGAYPAPPPSYFIDRLLEMQEGQMFQSVHYGKNLMGSYASQLSPEERWKVISYIKQMQAEFIANERKKEDSTLVVDDVLNVILGNNTYKHAAPFARKVGSFSAEAPIKIVESELDKIKEPLKSGQSIQLNNVFFKTASSELLKESYLELNKLVKILQSNSEIKVELGGHTDNTGDAKKNITLSSERAQAVYNYLLRMGIPKDRLTAKGYGSSNPVAPNTTEEGRAKNRRTAFTVL